MEQFARLKDFPNYAISNHGRVLNIERQTYLSPSINRDGYYIVNLRNNDNKTRHTFSIHRLIALCFIDNQNNHRCVDHIDRNKTNNNINNLRWVSHQENNRNRTKFQNCSSKFKGVCFDKRSNKWKTEIRIIKKIHLGYFDTEKDAAKAYNDYIINNKLTHFVLNDFTEQDFDCESSQLNEPLK